MLLTEARRAARVSASGELVTLDEQDRGAWDAALIAEGHRLVRERLAAGVGSGPLPDPRGDQRRAHLRPRRARHRLVADRRPLRPARPPRPLADRRPQPGRRGRRARRPGGGAGDRRPARGRAGRLPRLPRDPRRPAAPAGPQPRRRARRTTGPSSWRATPPRSTCARSSSNRAAGGWSQSAIAYAKICNAVYAGVHATLYKGETGRLRRDRPARKQQPEQSSRPSVSPVAFLTAAKKAGMKTLRRVRAQPVLRRPDRDADDEAAGHPLRQRADRDHAREHQRADRAVSRPVRAAAALDHRVRLPDESARPGLRRLVVRRRRAT